MRFISGKVGGYDSLEYAKSVLNKVGNINKIKVFNSEKTSYFEDFALEKYYYNFIMFDDRDNEIWFDTNCGYRGSKPSITEQILQLFGVRKEYGIYEKKHIEEKELEIINDLNILVIKYSQLSRNTKELFMIKLKPSKAGDRFNVINALSNIGTFKSYEDKMVEYNLRFRDTYEDESFGEYRVNQIFSINKNLNNLDLESLKKVFEVIIYKNIGMAVEIEIQAL